MGVKHDPMYDVGNLEYLGSSPYSKGNPFSNGKFNVWWLGTKDNSKCPICGKPGVTWVFSERCGYKYNIQEKRKADYSPNSSKIFSINLIWVLLSTFILIMENLIRVFFFSN